MKNLFFVALVGVLTSCGFSVNVDQIIGKWKLVGVTESADSPLAKKGIYEMDDCDKQTVWEFTNEDSTPLSDGTEVKKMAATAPEDCKFYGFEGKWGVISGKVFLSTSSVGGIGGRSYAGQFEIAELSATNLSIKTKNVQYSFEKVK